MTNITLHVPLSFPLLFLRTSLVLLFFMPSAGDTVQSQQPVPTSVEEKFLENIRQLTFEGSRAGEGYFSSDGTMMVFQSERRKDNPFFQIYLLDFETGDIEPISPGTGKTTCSWIHPNNRWVLYSSTHDDPQAVQKQKDEIAFRESGQTRRYAWDYDPQYEIYVYDRQENNHRRLTDQLGYDAEASFSPDGNLIAFASNRRGYTNKLTDEQRAKFEHDPSYLMDIYLMNADGSGVRQLTDHPGYDGGPFFSPDGQRICWRRFSEDGLTAEIMTMKIDGSDVKQLTNMRVMSWAPFFHPSGEYLIFATNKHGFGNFELYIIDAAGKSMPVRVTDTEGFDGLASFSPDGKKLTWTSGRNPQKESQIYLADWNHQTAMAALAAGLDSTTVADSLTESSEEMLLELEPAFDLTDLGEPIAFAQGQAAAGTTENGFRPADIAQHVEFLCSPELEGRLTGTPGDRKAAAYTAGFFQALGLSPAGDNGSWFQQFEFPAGVEFGTDNSLSITQQDAVDENAQLHIDWVPLTFTGNIEVPATEVVFAGYGIVAPAEGDQSAYDSYADIDVDGKWVLIFRFVPEDVPASRRQHLQFYASLRKKAFYARERGAIGMVVVSGPASQVQNQLVPPQKDFTPSGTRLAAISVSDQLVSQWFSLNQKDLASTQAEFDNETSNNGFPLSGIKISANLDVNNVKGIGYNVIAKLPAGVDAAPSAVLIGAHVDHLGRGETGTSIATDESKDEIHWGADDNASGVAGVLEVAQFLVDQQRSGRLPLKRDVLFAIWSGEELGLHGSKHYADSIKGDWQPASVGNAESTDSTSTGRSYVLSIGSDGQIMANDDPVDPSRLKFNLDYLRQNHPDYEIEIVQQAGNLQADVDQLIATVKENGIQRIRVTTSSAGTTNRPLAAALNMDMIGRLRDRVVLQGTGSSDYWSSAVEARNVVVGLPIALSADTNLPTDASSFYTIGIPILSAFTGAHGDYHTPRDTPDKLNYQGAADVSRLMALILRGLAIDSDIPNYLRQESTAQRAPRAGLRAWLGSAPSYGEDVLGVLLSDVSAGSPLDKAGVRGGDVIISLAGQEIENIYDYTAAIDTLKIGEEVEIIIQRNGQSISKKVTPGSRQ